MSPMPNKRSPEVLAKIDKLRRQVARAEAKGNTDTCHHQVLANYLGKYPAAGVTPQNADNGDKETTNG